MPKRTKTAIKKTHYTLIGGRLQMCDLKLAANRAREMRDAGFSADLAFLKIKEEFGCSDKDAGFALGLAGGGPA